MKRSKKIHQAALGYVASSIFIGPFLLVLVGYFAPGPIGDCQDDQWSRVPAASSLTQRADIIRHYFLITQIGEGIMLVVGLIILILIIAENRKRNNQSAFLLFGVLFMILGYGIAIWFLGVSTPCGSF